MGLTQADRIKGARNSPMTKKGVLGKKEQWDVLGKYMTEAGAKKYLAWIKKLPADKFAREYREMLNYFKPKQQSQNVKSQTDIHISLLPTDNNILQTLSPNEETKIIENE